MKTLVLSDIHLSHHPLSAVQNGRRIDEQADVVVLAGDIDDGLGGFRWARETFEDKPIVMVAGNHEFYGRNWTRNLDDMREAARKYDIEFLECDPVDLGGVRFLGCTLWTNFELYGTESQAEAIRVAKASMNDFVQIQISRTPETYWIHSKTLVPLLVQQRHQGSVEWLKDALAIGDLTKTVVVTHFAPHRNSVPSRFKDDLLSAAYASNLEHLMGKSVLWIHGHLHASSDYVVNGTRVVCNPHGYLHNNGGMENSEFNPSFTVEIPS